MSTLSNRPTPKMPLIATPTKAVYYPNSDGEPMSDNTLQFDWINLIKWELDALFAADPAVFVAGDLLWYPVEGDNKTRMAPDAMVAFGPGKGYRGSYKQWEEQNIAPQVAFEILSPGNRTGKMARKLAFYEKYGVEEYYLYDPDDFSFVGWLRDAQTQRFSPIDPADGFVSPRLSVRFDAPGDREMVIYRPDGTPFRTPLEIRQALERMEGERDAVAAERDVVAADRDRLAAKLHDLGIDPATL